jgi:Arylsulfotransferase (ASST)
MRGNLRKNWAQLYFFLSVVLMLFAYGVAVGLFRIFPYGILETLAAAAVDWMRYPRHYARLVPEKFLAPARRPGNGVVKHVADKVYPGQTFMTGLFGKEVQGMKLIDMNGRTLHQWHVSFNEIWTEAPHLEKKPHDWDTQIHGAILYPDGDVVFNFQYAGLVRIDRCSRVRWRLAQQTHHSVFRDNMGNLWVPGRRRRETPVDRFHKVPAPFEEEFILKVSPDGKVLGQISLLDVIFRSTHEGLLFASGTHDAQVLMPLDRDFTHLNDIEVLAPEMAAAFPAFETGDMLVSLRNLNLVMVLSADGSEIKWSMTGPYLRQHDPDFVPNGRISLFDNRRDGAGGRLLGGSRIVEVAPLTRNVVTLYGVRSDERFYTETMGDHQRLPNGNILITESESGHVFEVTAEAEVVWSFINRWDDDSVALIGGATRYPDHYMTPSEKECS